MACTRNLPSTVTFVAKYKSVISVLSKLEYEMCSRKCNSMRTIITGGSYVYHLVYV